MKKHAFTAGSAARMGAALLTCGLVIFSMGCPPGTVDLCTNVACDDGFTCDAATGTCVAADPCADVSCADGETCVDGACVAGDPCADVTCPDGETCADGACVASDPCDGVTCQDGETCVDGTCVPDDTSGRTYVGSDGCLACHGAAAVTGTDKSNFWNTGHPYKLNAVEDGTAPEYPVTTLAGPPDGIEWADTSFVIGGFRYKYRVVDNDGFVVLGPTAQYNFPSQGRSGYSNDADHTAPDGTPGPWETNIGRKPYNCGKCHTTGYDADTENHLGLTGLVGDWAFEGIHCEECHGAGSAHVASSADEKKATINGNPDTDAVCGKCHTRSPDGVQVSGGFVRHHEQWDEFSRSVHYRKEGFESGCMTCHDVHEPIFDAERLAAIQDAFTAGNMRAMAGLATPPGIIKECTDCHTDMAVTHAGPSECKTCHMAYTDKSAVAINEFAGDIRSHIWAINEDVDASMFADADGNQVGRDDENAAFLALDGDGNTFITLDFVCLQCHADEDLAWAVANHGSIHGTTHE